MTSTNANDLSGKIASGSVKLAIRGAFSSKIQKL